MIPLLMVALLVLVLLQCLIVGWRCRSCGATDEGTIIDFLLYNFRHKCTERKTHDEEDQ
jgi:hypothetical protein